MGSMEEALAHLGFKLCLVCGCVLWAGDPDVCEKCREKAARSIMGIVGIVGPVVDALEMMLGYCRLPEPEGDTE